MTTGWGADHLESPRIAWALARDTAAGRGPAAVKEIPPASRPEVIVVMGAQVRSFLVDAAMRGLVTVPDPLDWTGDVPHVDVRRLAAAALKGRQVSVPPKLCPGCTAGALVKMAETLLDVMTDAGVPRRDLASTLDWLAARAR